MTGRILNGVSVAAAALFFSSCGEEVFIADISDYGAVAGGQDCTRAVTEALEDCAGHRSSKIVFPEGEYHFYGDDGKDKYTFVSNNDEGLKRVVFLMENMENVEIDGSGSDFIFYGHLNPFVVENCDNVIFRNFSVDFDRPFHSEGKIIANHAEGIDIEISEEFPYKVSNGVLVFTGRDMKEERKTTVSMRSDYPYGSLLEFDPVKRETAFMARDFYLDGNPLPAREIGENRVRVFLDGLHGTPGNIMLFAPSHRNYPAVVFTDCHDCLVENVTLYHAGGMGIVGQRSSDIRVTGCTVTPAENRIVSCTADATHFTNCSGSLVLDHNLFENQVDDATNIHGIYVKVSEVLAPNRVVVDLIHKQQQGFDFLKKGMQVEIIEHMSLVEKDRATVVSAKRINKTRTVLTIDKAADIAEGDAIACCDAYPEVHIYENTMRGNRARGMLLDSRGKTVVENNYFHSPGAAILFEGDASFWYEQGGVSDCLIRNNVFDNCLYGVWGKAVIDVGSGIHKDRETSRYNKNIRVIDNTFRIFDKPLLLDAYCVDGLEWRGNVIEKTDDYPAVHANKTFYKTEHCDNVNIEPLTEK